MKGTLSINGFGVARAALAFGLAVSGTAFAQATATPQVSLPVVQAVPGLKGMRLNNALNRLGRNPQDTDALIEAGEASLELGDIQAAMGFYQRATSLSAANPKAKAGLAAALVLSQDPFSAIPLFEEAARAGPLEPARLADRGLAYDLVGDNLTAQGYYRQSLAGGPSDEAVRRLAISQAISGDRKAMEVTLSPLLQRQDKAAWRTRAFGLAIIGNADEAESIARQSMPGPMANSMAAYLRYMPKLTAAQQAAAANLGSFPRAAQIGQDDPRVAAFARPKAVLAAAAPVPAQARPNPARRPGRTDPAARSPDRNQPATAAAPQAPVQNVAPPEPKVERKVDGAPVQLASNIPNPEPSRAELPPVQTPAVQPPVPTPQPAIKAEPAQPGFATLDGASVAGTLSKPIVAQASPPVATAPAPVPAPISAPAPARPRPSLDEAFADLSRPSLEIEPKAGAVDLRKLKPTTLAAKDKAKDDAAQGKESTKDKDKGKPAKPSHPSRTWVQVATGRDKKALAFDWNRMVKADPAVFKGKKGFTSAWGQTNRLLTGPFETDAAANAYIAQLKKAGVSGAFLWSSPAGQVVDALPAGK